MLIQWSKSGFRGSALQSQFTRIRTCAVIPGFTTGGGASGERAHAFRATNPYISGRFGTSSGGTIRLPGSSRIRSNNLAAFM